MLLQLGTQCLKIVSKKSHFSSWNYAWQKINIIDLVTLSDHFIGNENFPHNLQTLWSVHTSFSRKGLIFLIFIIHIKIFPAHHFSCYHSRSFCKLCPLWKVSLSRNIGEMRCDCWPKFFLLFFVWSPPRNVKIPFLRPFIVALKR